MASIKEAALDMDLMLRMRILEGATDADKWAYSRNARAIHAAMSEVPQQFPEIDSSWFIPRDLKIYETMLAGARSVLSAQTGELTAEEVIQNMIGGFSASGSVKKDILGEVGRYQSKGILAGHVTPMKVKQALAGLAKRRALDTARKRMRSWRPEKDRPEGPMEVTIETPERPGQLSSDVWLDRSPLTVILSLISGPMGTRFKTWVYKVIQQKASPVQKAVMEALLEGIQSGQKLSNADLGSSDQVVEAVGRPITGQMAGRHVLSMIDVIKTEIEKDPTVLDWMDRYLDSASLGYGGGELRLAMIRRVASRYLLGSRQLTPGGLLISFEGNRFSMQTLPSGPGNQVYDASILLDQPAKPFKAALKVIQENWSAIQRMKRLYEVTEFVDKKVQALIGKSPRWHEYSMPD